MKSPFILLVHDSQKYIKFQGLFVQKHKQQIYSLLLLLLQEISLKDADNIFDPLLVVLADNRETGYELMEERVGFLVCSKLVLEFVHELHLVGYSLALTLYDSFVGVKDLSLVEHNLLFTLLRLYFHYNLTNFLDFPNRGIRLEQSFYELNTNFVIFSLFEVPKDQIGLLS